MKKCRDAMLLYAVTDRRWAKNTTLINQTESALKGGATCVQLREKELDFDTFLQEATCLKQLCAEYNVPLIINDNIDIALKSKADGIHVGQKDTKASEVRRLIGKNMLLGVSVGNTKEALEAEKSGADYLGVGTVFATYTKPDADSVSIDTLKEICKSVKIPVVAIGGINMGNIPKLSGCGIDGVALVSAIFAAENIEDECRNLKEAVERIIKKDV